jgi:hypothetical protein
VADSRWCMAFAMNVTRVSDGPERVSMIINFRQHAIRLYLEKITGLKLHIKQDSNSFWYQTTRRTAGGVDWVLKCNYGRFTIKALPLSAKNDPHATPEVMWQGPVKNIGEVTAVIRAEYIPELEQLS